MMSKFGELFDRIKSRPGMYFRDNELIEAMNFIAGMDAMQDEPLGGAFRKWILKNKLKRKASVIWPCLVTIYMNEKGIDQNHRVNEFLSLFSEFLQDSGHV